MPSSSSRSRPADTPGKAGTAADTPPRGAAAPAGKAGPRRDRGRGVDPVLQAPRPQVGGVVVALAGRELAQVGAAEPLPGGEEARLAGLGVRVREVEPEV